MGTTTGTTPPSTHAIWNRDSKAAKVRPRLASGASRWTTASNACFPAAAARATPDANSAWPNNPPKRSPAPPAIAATAALPSNRNSSRNTLRNTGAMAAPASPPATLTATITPKCQAGGAPGGARSPIVTGEWSIAAAEIRPSTSPCSVIRSSPRRANAIRNVTNPTTARSEPITEPAETTAPLRSSAVSSAPAGSSATVVAGTRSAARPAPTNTIAANTITAGAPINNSNSPGRPTANPPSPDSSCSLEFASTRAESESTTVGTIAALATW